jgi:nicotinate-nucleotide adenylyltransferase
MRVGVFGGSFDPVHLAHLILAEQCREQAELDQVWFIPAPRPPHKRDGTWASFEDRVAMLRLAIAEHPAFAIDTCETDRAGLSYTFETLRTLQARHPSNQYYLIVGSDSVRDLATWREPQIIAELATLLILERPGSALVVPPAYFQFMRITAPLLDISSSDIRLRRQAGKSVRYLVPDQVQAYMAERGLYEASKGTVESGA